MTQEWTIHYSEGRGHYVNEFHVDTKDFFRYPNGDLVVYTGEPGAKNVAKLYIAAHA